MTDDVMTADEARALLADVAPRRVCAMCGAVDPPTVRDTIGGDAVDLHDGCSGEVRGRVDTERGLLRYEDALRALRAVIALHERVASRDRHAAFYMRQAFVCAVDATRRVDALALRGVLPDAWERLRDAPEPEWPTAGVHPEAPDDVAFRAAWLAGAAAGREEAAEVCDRVALFHHPTMRSVIAASLAERIRALPPAAPPGPPQGAEEAPDAPT